MSWEDQGRQYHGWFGNGTSGVADAARSATREDVAGAVARGALGHLQPVARAELEGFAGQDGWARLTRSIVIWAAASGMEAHRFRETLVGPGLSSAGAASLHAMAREVAAARGPEGIAAASEHLARALGATGRDGLSYGLAYAQDTAIYAAANGQVPVGDMPAPGGAAPAPVVAPIGTAIAASPGATLLGGRALLAFLGGLSGAALAGITILLWPKPAGDIRPMQSAPPSGGDAPPEGGKPETTAEGKAGTQDRPPPGSRGINETEWSGDHKAIKGGITAKPADDVRILPTCDVSHKHPDCSWTNNGPASSFVGSGKPSGRTGKDREGNRHGRGRR